jgi:transcriptional regulator of aromatic amino acid metabolism
MESSRKQTQDYQDKVIKFLDNCKEHKQVFTPFEESIIRKYYPIRSTKDIAKSLGKTPSQIAHKATHLGVKKKKEDK